MRGGARMVGCRAELVRRGAGLKASGRKWSKVVGTHRRMLVTTWKPQLACIHLPYKLLHTFPLVLSIIVLLLIFLIKPCIAFFTSQSGSKGLLKLGSTTCQLLSRFRLVAAAAEDVGRGGEVVRGQADCWKTEVGLG